MSEPVEVVLQRFQNTILEAVALGAPIAEVAALMCRKVEALAPGVICSLLRVRDGRLYPIAAPSLPAAYSERLVGLPIGPTVGTCGTAAYFRRSVAVLDITTDPLWADYRDLAVMVGMTACWSMPVTVTDGEVVAIFGLYFEEPRGPTDLERRLVEAGVHLSAIAVASSDAKEANRRLAHYDPLTGLPNRRLFDAAIAALCADPSARFGLLLIGFDRLDSLDIGVDEISSERLLREVAARLEELGGGASASSLGGGRFAVLVEPCADRQRLREVGQTVLAALKHPRDWLSGPLERGVSIGGVLCGSDGTTPEVLRQNAELARAASRSATQHGVAIFEPGLRAAALRRRAVMRDVETALGEGRLVPHYQPVVNLVDGRIIGLEALMRMRMRDGRITPAAEFSEAFAEPRLAHALTDRLLEDVARDAAGWLAAGIEFGHVGINVAMADFLDELLPQRIEGAFGKAGLPLRHVVVEITETIAMDDPNHDVADIVQGLRAKGLLVALDDFGTGFASLTHLLTFPSDIIKIDRSFIDGMLTDGHCAAIVESLIDIARRLGKRVVAEGVETAAQAERLLELGCGLGQGYLYARPADALTTTFRLSGRMAASA